MLSKYFQERFENMPRPEGLSAEEARQLVIDAYRLLISNRLIAGGADVQVEGTTKDELDTLLRLADYLSAYTAISANLSQVQVSSSTISSANFVAAQIFEFLAEYRAAAGSDSLAEEQEADDTKRLSFNGFEFWTEEGYLWINAIAHYLLARHDGNATTLTRRFRKLPEQTNGSDLATWSVGSDIGYRLASTVVEVVVSFLGCDFLRVLRVAEDRDAVFRDIQATSNDFELVDLALISAFFDIAEACVQMARALIILAEVEARKTRPWLETLNQAQQTADLLNDAALKWIIDLLRRVMDDFVERGLLFAKFPDPSPTSDRWYKYLEHRAQGGRALLWPAHLEAIDRGSISPQTSIVISMPTGSGKSFIAEMRIAAALQNAKDAWVLYVVPTNALVRQVTRDLKEALEPLVTTVRGFVTDREYTYLSLESLLPDEIPAKPVNYIAVMTPEKLRLAVSLWSEVFETCVLCVVDEAHLISKPRRGSLLDLVLAQLRTINTRVPFLLLSAMMSNPDDLAQWLGGVDYLDERRLTRQALMLGVPEKWENATLVGKRKRIGDLYFGSVYRSDWEPSSENIKWIILENACVFEQGKDGEPFKFKPTDTARNCTESLVKAGLKSILFVPSIRPESSARILGDSLNLAGPDDTGLDVWERILRRELGVDKPEIVARLRQGVCYHKGPMLTQEQVLAEHYFATSKKVRLMVCTSTLSYGVNLPIEALVFAGTKRYDRESNKMTEITSADFLNIAGRAGRPAFANQGLVQVLPNWLSWKPLKEQYQELQKLYLTPSKEELKVVSGLCNLLDQISVAGGIDSPSDELSAAVTAWFGRVEDESLLRHTYAFFLRAKELDDEEEIDQYAHRITTSIAEWIRRQEEEFPLSPIAREAFKRSGLPSRTCRYLYREAGRILETLSPLKGSANGEKSFRHWLDKVVESVQSQDCNFFYRPRVEVGDTSVRDDWEKIWEYETEALHLWLSWATREELMTSRFAKGGGDYWSKHRASMFINRTTQQYAFALGSLLFFLECRWREQDPDSRSWDRKPKDLGLEWKPHVAHLPLAVKWGVGSISALAWTLAGVHFRFAANALGEIYPSDDVGHDVEEQFRRVKRLLEEYRSNYPHRPDLTVEALRIQSGMKGLDYDAEFLKDVADACCGVESY